MFLKFRFGLYSESRDKMNMAGVGLNRLGERFKELKMRGRCAFIAYITAGDPTLDTTAELLFELQLRGVDIVELGVPFSDPLADGPVIQRASLRALRAGATLEKIICLVEAHREDIRIPICFMSYYNPIYKFGLGRFCRRAKQAGIDGLIVPDLPPEEAGELIFCAEKSRLAMSFFVSPMSSARRIRVAARYSSGFIYYVSLTGITGARKSLAVGLSRRITLVKKYASGPVCLGFGLSTRRQVEQAGRFCDGVIVGSAIVRKIEENIGRGDLVKKVGRFVYSLMEG
ncbi:MAG: tryptophan synthase subunit alpha [Candidatus Omnitrophota bacterium]